MRIPLDHDVRVVGQPDRAVFRWHAIAEPQQGLLPAFIHRAAGFAQAVGHTHGLHRIMVLELPAQVFAGYETPQPRMERAHVVVLQVNLDEGFPVVVAFMQFDVVQHVAGEIQVGQRAHASQVGRHIAAGLSLGFPARLEQQSIPFLQSVVVQVQARILGEMGCADQGSGLGRGPAAVGPAVQGAHQVAGSTARPVGQQVTAPFKHHGLPVAAYVGDQFDPVGGAHQYPPIAFLRQRVVVAWLGHCQVVPHVMGPGLENTGLFALVQRGVKVA